MRSKKIKRTYFLISVFNIFTNNLKEDKTVACEVFR